MERNSCGVLLKRQQVRILNRMPSDWHPQTGTAGERRPAQLVRCQESNYESVANRITKDLREMFTTQYLHIAPSRRDRLRATIISEVPVTACGTKPQTHPPGQKPTTPSPKLPQAACGPRRNSSRSPATRTLGCDSWPQEHPLSFKGRRSNVRWMKPVSTQCGAPS